MLQVSPKMPPRLTEIEKDLILRRKRAEWVPGLRLPKDEGHGVSE